MRAGGDKRPPARQRRRNRAWLLETFDVDLGPDLARCHLAISENCRGTVDAATLTMDRIDPGGSYCRANIQPACTPCQNKQGALITRERRHQWFGWVQEAQAAGVEWDGVL